MTKNTSKLLVAALATTAIVAPISSVASAASSVEAGVYFAATKEFYTTEQLGKLSTQKIGKLFADNKASEVFIYTTGVGTATLAQANASDFITAANQNGFKDEPAKIIPQGSYVAQDGSKVEVGVVDLKVESVSAINKTTVQLVLSKEVDSVTATNFAIEGGNVTAASLADDKKTVTLSVSGLNYATDYTVAVTGVLVDGEASDFGSKGFTTPAVTDLWDLQISTAEASLIADGADNTVVTFKLVDKTTGEVDVNADNVVLDLNTTYGTLAQKRVTVQDGVATVLLTSEFSNTDINAKIDAQIIEASGDYKDLINHVVGTHQVPFKTSTTENVDTLTLVSAEANQADRVTLFFDKEVSLKHFVKTNATGELLYRVGVVEYTAENIPANTPPENISHVFKVAGKTVELAQGANTNFKVQGFKPVAGNSKAIEVILDKTTVLKDNAAVKVDVVAVNSLGKETISSADFKVTDARKPEATAVNVEGLNTLKVKFSEAIADATFKIDGRFNSPTHFTYNFGEFNPVTLVDNRDLATIKLTNAYDEDGIADNDSANTTLAGYFSAGEHTLQISSTKDFAFATDPNNLGTTQNLKFNIAADSAKPNATVTVESPEQFRLKFDKSLSLANAAALQGLITSGDIQLQFLDTDGEYKDVDGRVANKGKVDKSTDYNVERVSASEYVIELKKDWTVIYNTNAENKNYYNDKFRLFIKKNAVTSVTNGLKNEEIKLDLNYAGSPLNTPDTTSPVINTIERVTSGGSNFHVTMSEPVKLNGHVTNETETLAQGQANLQDTTVQFIGKDKNGATVTINGQVIGYADKNDADKMLNVSWAFQADGTTANTVTPQTVVDAGGSEDWTIVIRSISDDVGNTAASATKDFKVKKSAATDTPFFVKKYTVGNPKAGKHMVEGEGNGNAADTIKITFSEGVQYSGLSDATNPANYTLNGVTLPAGTSIAIADADANTTNGFEIVEITLPDGTLNIGANVSNVITVNKNLISYDGSKLIGETELIVNVDENNVLAVQAAAVAQIEDVVQNTGDASAIDETTINTATGLTTAIVGNITEYRAAIVAAADGALDTPAKIAAMVDQVNVDKVAAGIANTLSVTTGATTLPAVAAGYTIEVKTTSDATKYDLTGTGVADGTSTVVYTVKHTASGKTADTGNVTVTVAP